MKRVLKKICLIICLAAMCVQTMPVLAAFDTPGKQIIEKCNLESLLPTQSENIYETVDGEYLMKAEEDKYIVLERHTFSLDNETIFKAQLDSLDIPDDLKESIVDKYNYLESQGRTENAEVSIYEGLNKIDSNGRSTIDDLPIIDFEGRKFKCYTVTYGDLAIRETVKQGSSVYQYLKNASSIVISIIGLPGVLQSTPVIVGAAGLGLTFLDLIEQWTNSIITGHMDDEHWIDGNYSTVLNTYYIYSDALESWNRVLDTQFVEVEDLKFTSYTVGEVAPNMYEGSTSILATYNDILTTPSYSQALPVALEHQFLPKIEYLSMEYLGYRIDF